MSIIEVWERANGFAQSLIDRDRAIAGESLKAARQLKQLERKQLIARKPKRTFSAKDGYYDPLRPWLFHTKAGEIREDEALRDHHARLYRIDAALKN